MEEIKVDPKTVDDLRGVLAGFPQEDTSGDPVLLERLRRKAKQGTVKDEMHLW